MGSAWTLFVTFFKVGALSFGGGPAAISLMREELTSNTTLNDQEFTEGLALSNALPGPIISNVAIFAGLKLGGLGSALAAVLGSLVAPCAFMLIGGYWVIANHNMALVQAALKGVRPAAVALLAYTVIKLVPTSVGQWDQAVIGVATLAGLLFLPLHPAVAILVSGLVGIALYR